MATAPAFAATPSIQSAGITVANVARDGTGTLTTVFVAGSNGSRIERVSVTTTGTMTAGTITLFLVDNLSNARLYREILATAVTASTTVAAFFAQLSLGIVLPSGWSLKAGATTITGSTTIQVTAEGAHL